MYLTTPAGRELRPIIEMLGVWGQRWVRSQLGPQDLDPGLLMWDIRRNVDRTRFPVRRTVVEFRFTDGPKNKRRWWILSDQHEIDLCVTDPGFEVDLYVVTDVRTLTQIWMGDLVLDRALRSGRVELIGRAALRRKLRSWLGLSTFAGVKPARRDLPAPRMAH